MAALLGLLMESLLGLGGQVGRVELRVRGEDRSHVLAERRVVDRLGDRDELRTGPADGKRDLDVIGQVARQPVDLVDDHVADLVLGDEGEQTLEFGPVGRAGRLAAVDELLDDLRLELLGLALAGLPLRGDGEALGLVTAPGLLHGRDPQVGDGRCARHVATASGSSSPSWSIRTRIAATLTPKRRASTRSSRRPSS